MIGLFFELIIVFLNRFWTSQFGIFRVWGPFILPNLSMESIEMLKGFASGSTQRFSVLIKEWLRLFTYFVIECILLLILISVKIRLLLGLLFGGG